MGGRVIARAQCPEICDAIGWPALPSRQSTSSTTELSRRQLWKAANLPNNKVYNLRTDLHLCLRTLDLHQINWITTDPQQGNYY